jgi:hypothetical protein
MRCRTAGSARGTRAASRGGSGLSSPSLRASAAASYGACTFTSLSK